MWNTIESNSGLLFVVVLVLYRDLIRIAQPPPQIHQSASVGAKRVKSALFLGRSGLGHGDLALADRAFRGQRFVGHMPRKLALGRWGANRLAGCAMPRAARPTARKQDANW